LSTTASRLHVSWKRLSTSATNRGGAQGNNGAEAIKLYRQEKPDTIRIDMNMPIMDGLTAPRHLRQMDSEVKVVTVTSLGGVGDEYTEAFDLGACDVISRPVRQRKCPAHPVQDQLNREGKMAVKFFGQYPIEQGVITPAELLEAIGLHESTNRETAQDMG